MEMKGVDSEEVVQEMKEEGTSGLVEEDPEECFKKQSKIHNLLLHPMPGGRQAV